jgi:hypothetical protein
MKEKIGKISVLVVLLVFGAAMLFPTVLAQSEKGIHSPGHTGTTPGKEGTPPGQGGTPPGIGMHLGLTVDGDNVYWEDPDINVGIGTADPEYSLDVNGDIHAMGSLILGNSVILDPNGYMILDDNTPTLEFYNKDTIPPYTDLFIDSGNKFIGMGTKTVISNVRLSIDGNVLASGTITANGLAIDGTASGTAFTDWDKDTSNDLLTSTDFAGDVTGKFDNLQLSSGVVGSAEIDTGAVGSDELASSGVTIGTYGSTTQVPSFTVDADGRITAASNNAFSESDPKIGTNTLNYVPKWDGTKLVTSSIYDNGKIGIGTTNPSESLEVVGNVKATKFIGDGSLLENLPASTGLWTQSGSNIYYNSGKVGIGTSSPSEKLYVEGNVAVTGSMEIAEDARYGGGMVTKVYDGSLSGTRDITLFYLPSGSSAWVEIIAVLNEEGRDRPWPLSDIEDGQYYRHTEWSWIREQYDNPKYSTLMNHYTRKFGAAGSYAFSATTIADGNYIDLRVAGDNGHYKVIVNYIICT